jgi:hypothetical protein
MSIRYIQVVHTSGMYILKHILWVVSAICRCTVWCPSSLGEGAECSLQRWASDIATTIVFLEVDEGVCSRLPSPLVGSTLLPLGHQAIWLMKTSASTCCVYFVTCCPLLLFLFFASSSS